MSTDQTAAASAAAAGGITATDPIRYLSRAECAQVRPSFARGVQLIRETLTAAANGAVELPPKPGVHPRPDAFIHAMPVYVGTTDATGVKWISGFPDNPAAGLPYITGLLLLNDAATGLPTAVMDAEIVTAYRTACVSGLSIEVLANDPDGVYALAGCGVQGRWHLDLIAELHPNVREIRLFDALDGVAERTAAEYADRLPVRVCPTLREAVEGAEIIMTPVAERAEAAGAIIVPEWIADGALLLPLANDFGWTAEALERADVVFSDDFGQFQSFIDRGEMTRSRGLTDVREFRDVIVGRIAGRTSPQQIVCGVNLGLGMHDITLAVAVHEAATAQGIGVDLER